MGKVLIAAQQPALRRAIARVVTSAGYAVELAEGDKPALEVAAGGDVEAAIIVVGAGRASLVQALRDKIPRTIVLRDRTEGIVGRESLGGANTFRWQDFDEQELLGQIRGTKTSLEKAGRAAPAPVIVSVETFRFDPDSRTYFDHNGQEVVLTRAETALLTALIASLGRPLSRDKLRRAVVGHGAEPDDRSVDMLVGRLRRKIEPNPRVPRFIITVSGVGYKFAAGAHIQEGDKSASTSELEQRTEVGESGLDRSGPGPVAASAPEAIALPHSEPHRRQLTALSCGLVGSRALASNLDAEDLGEVLSAFQKICTTVITRWGGTATGSVTDEILALFGHPKGHEDDAERAVHAGLELVTKFGEILSPSGEALQVRVGIATGLVLIGENQAAVGGALITAARLQNIALPNAVVVAADTRKLLGSAFACDDTGSHELERNSEPVKTYRVTGERAVESRFAASRAGKLTQLVGRQHELQQLVALWELSKEGKGQIALLCGEAGIGKSRLCQALLDRINDEEHVTIRYQCSPHHTNSPFFPVISQLEQAARFEREDTSDQKLTKLEAELAKARVATLGNIPLFTTLLSIPSEFFALPVMTPQRQRELTIVALIRQILALALTRPVVIMLKDAHWLDSSTLELFNRCIDAIKTARVFALVSFRPEFFPHWLEWSHVTMLRLNRLAREQTAEIIADVAGHKALPGDVYEQIITKSDGVPLFAEELTKTVLESGLLQDAGSKYVTVGQLASLSVPTTLLGSLTARLDRLGPAKEIAQVGAAIGREFSHRLLAAVAPSSGPALEAAIAQLAALELIFVRGETLDRIYTFKHALVQDAAYDMMLRSNRRQLHGRIANALFEQSPETVETQPELIAHHLAEAGLTEQAIDYLQKAGQRAIERSASTEAIGHLTYALNLIERLSESPGRDRRAFGLEVMLAQAMIATFGYAAPKTREVLLRAKRRIDDLTEPSLKFAILYGIWASHYVGAEGAKQKDAALEFIAEAERSDDTAAICIAHRALGTTYLTLGEFAAGLPHLQRARALYHAEHHASYRYQYGQDIGVAALCYLGWALWHLGDVDRALAIAADAIRDAEDQSHPHTLVYTICHARLFMDGFRRADNDMQSYASFAASLCTEHGFSHWLNCARIFEGWAEINRGDLDRGLQTLRAGVAGWQEGGARLWLPFFLMLEAEGCSKANLGQLALKKIDEALAICKKTGERWAMAEVLRVKALLLQESGPVEPNEIEAVLVNSLEIARSQQARCWELRTSCDLARLWKSLGRAGDGLKLLQSIYDRFTEGFDGSDLRKAKALIESLKRTGDQKHSSHS